MKIASLMKPSKMKEVYLDKPSIHICMHLAGSARTDSRVMRDAIALVGAGFTVTIVDVEGKRTRPASEDINGVHLKHIFMPNFYTSTSFKPWYLFKLAMVTIQGTIQLLSIKADIYHSHVEKALPACYIVTRLRNKPLIVDTPDLTLSTPNILRWPRLRSLAIRVIRHMVSNCAGYITASPHYFEELKKLYGVKEFTLIQNVPPYQVIFQSDRLRQNLGLAPNIKLALYQGAIQTNRSLDKLIYVASFLNPDIVIVIMGNGPESLKASLEEIIKCERLSDRVKIIPAVPYEELIEWTASADLGLIVLQPDYSLSIRKTLPNKLFEYIMAGIPVLATSLDAVSEIVKTYNVGSIISSFMPRDIAMAINAMLDNQADLELMRHNALDAARNEFYWEKESQKLISLYTEILSQHQLKRIR